MREANITVSEAGFEAMGLEKLISLGREAGIRDFEELACHGTGAVIQVTVASRYDEAALSTLECVDQWEHVTETDDGHLYVIAFTAPALPDSLAAKTDDLVGTCDPQLNDRSATMSLVGSQESISGTIRAYEAAGISPDLLKLGPYEGRERPIDSLTDRQQQVIQTAFDMGYYDVPRAASTDEIAAELDLDASTVAEHLQRAERNVLGRLLE
ncbi:helix-turn-helix domain-containing protein [Halobacteria archaeon AArc-curdl1]|uniref:Helix-turn-helix domain-containing protein n=1 Tax=Natronosalvus hydrolyticus TaxID=2979988 RepID=A0AAP2Z8G9_9EURY|nr:helix-turn-helix domain-containing protein [Halobacteria archaeon AArc-curdl1]